MEDNPAWVFVPFLVTAGAVAAVLGCAWLVAVDLRVGHVVIALMAGAIAWKRAAPHAN